MDAKSIKVFEGNEQVANYIMDGDEWVNQSPPVGGVVAGLTLKDRMRLGEMDGLVKSRVFPYRKGGEVDAELKRMNLSSYDAWDIFERTNGKLSGDNLSFVVEN